MALRRARRFVVQRLLHRVPEPDRPWLESAIEQLRPGARVPGVSAFQALQAISWGFLPNRTHTLRLHARDDRELLLTDREVHRINQRHRHRQPLLPTQDKLLLSVLFSSIAGGACKLHGVILEGNFIPTRTDLPGTCGLLRLLDDFPLVLKPAVESGGGKGVTILTGSASQPLINGAVASFEQIETLARGHERSVVIAYAKQAAYADSIMPRCQGNIRLLTVRDPRERPYIAWAAHEFATTESELSNNFGDGGLSAEIDIASGRLGRAAMLRQDGRVTWLKRHPDTAAVVEGVEVPYWEAVKSAVSEVASRTPQLRLAGWDVIVTDDGPAIIEGEAHALTTAQQVHRPLLADPVVVGFLRREHLLMRPDPG